MVISLRKTVKIFDKQRVVDDVSVTFPSANITILVGPNGAGKTTLLRLLTGELKPDSGKITAKKKALKAIACENEFFTGFKISDYCTLWTLLYRGFDTKKFVSMLAEADINGRAKLHDLSAEKKTWFNISLVIASNADIMIFDEPLQDLNHDLKIRLLDLMVKEAKTGKTIVVSAQEIEELENFATFVAVLNNGSLVLSGKTEKILSSHRLFPVATTISPDFRVIGPVFNERLVETDDDIGRIATLKEIVLGYINGSSS